MTLSEVRAAGARASTAAELIEVRNGPFNDLQAAAYAGDVGHRTAVAAVGLYLDERLAELRMADGKRRARAMFLRGLEKPPC